MNLRIQVPKNWNPNCQTSFIAWQNRVNELVKASKY